MDPRLQKTILKQYWGADNKGAKFNVARIPISSTDFSTHVYSYYDKIDDYSLENFRIQVDHDIGKIDFIKVQSMSKEMSFFATSWAPPAWMTQQNTTIKNPTLRQDKNVPKIYAKYLLKFSRHTTS